MGNFILLAGLSTNRHRRMKETKTLDRIHFSRPLYIILFLIRSGLGQFFFTYKTQLNAETTPLICPMATDKLWWIPSWNISTGFLNLIDLVELSISCINFYLFYSWTKKVKCGEFNMGTELALGLNIMEHTTTGKKTYLHVFK